MRHEKPCAAAEGSAEWAIYPQLIAQRIRKPQGVRGVAREQVGYYHSQHTETTVNIGPTPCTTNRNRRLQFLEVCGTLICGPGQVTTVTNVGPPQSQWLRRFQQGPKGRGRYRVENVEVCRAMAL